MHEQLYIIKHYNYNLIIYYYTSKLGILITSGR
jgi:hypothetical protein